MCRNITPSPPQTTQRAPTPPRPRSPLDWPPTPPMSPNTLAGHRTRTHLFDVPDRIYLDLVNPDRLPRRTQAAPRQLCVINSRHDTTRQLIQEILLCEDHQLLQQMLITIRNTRQEDHGSPPKFNRTDLKNYEIAETLNEFASINVYNIDVVDRPRAQQHAPQPESGSP